MATDIEIARTFFSDLSDPFFSTGDILSFKTGRNQYMTNSSGSIWLGLKQSLERGGYRIVHENEDK